jgi:hypothetical protein
MENLKLMQLPVEHIHRAWDQIEPLLDSIEPYSNGECTTEQSKVELIKGISTTLVIVEAPNKIVGVIIGEWKMSPGKRVFFVTGWAGSNAMNDSLWEDVMTWVKCNGGTHIQGAGRDSVFRLHRQKRGFEKVYTVYEKEII